MSSAAVGSKAAVVLLFIFVAPIDYGCIRLAGVLLCGTFCPFYFLQSSHWEKESWLLVFLMTCGCYWYLPLSQCAANWSAVCDCSISWSYLKENADQEVNVSEKTGICSQTILLQT